MSFIPSRLYFHLILFNLLLVFAANNASAQNLVINPSFEDTFQCPYFVSQIDLAVNWHTSVNTPDYYHACNNTGAVNPGMVGVPNSARGYQPARTGNAFAGVVIYWTAQTDYREIFYAQLQSPLTAGVLYNVGMYAVMNEDNAMWAVDGGLGIYLSDSPINPNTPFAYTPQVANPLGNVLNDTLNWTEISENYLATGGEQYITIGSFIPDNMLTIINRGGTYPFTSYAIEDVWVIPDSLMTGIEYESPVSEVRVFPNPFQNEIKVITQSLNASDITIYDLTGRQLMHREFRTSASINAARLEKGTYLFRINSMDGSVEYGKLTKE